MEFIIKIDDKNKSAKKLIEYLKTLSFVKFQEIKPKLSKEDEVLLKIMQEREKGEHLTAEETEKFFNELWK